MSTSANQFPAAEFPDFSDVASAVRFHTEAGNLKPMQLAAWLGLTDDRKVYYWLGRDPDSRKGTVSSPAVNAWCRHLPGPIRLHVARAQFHGCGLGVSLLDVPTIPAGQIERRAVDVVGAAVETLREIQIANADGLISAEERPRVRARLAELRAIIDQVDGSLDGPAEPLRVMPPMRVARDGT